MSFVEELELLPYKVSGMYKFLRDSRRSKIPVPTAVWLWSLLRGYIGQHYYVYEFDRHDPAEYISDWARYRHLAALNQRHKILLNDKHVFSLALQGFPHLAPKTYCLLDHGTVLRAGSREPLRTVEDLVELCHRNGALVCKPRLGTQGQGVLIATYANGGFTVNGAPASAAELAARLRDQSDAVVVEYVLQAEYARRLYPDTVNTIRILTMWDVERREPFIAIAVQRIGNHRSAPVDNWTQGALDAEIVDLDTGELGPAVSFPAVRALQWHDRHPDSGAQITGLRIPHFREVARDVLEVASAFPRLPHVGWDVIVTDDGCRIIEGNMRSDLNLLQVHRPLLRDPRVRRLLAHHRIPAPKPRRAPRSAATPLPH